MTENSTKSVINAVLTKVLRTCDKCQIKTVLCCPQCNSDKIVKDGMRQSVYGEQQRYLCKSCYLRFSNSDPETKVQNLHNSFKESQTESGCVQICAEKKGVAKNLDNATIEKVAGETPDIKGKLVQYAWQLTKRGLAEETVKHRLYRLNVLVKKGADLTNPETVETILATEQWTPGNKRFFIMAYQSFCRTMNIEWVAPRNKWQPPQPFIPLESEIDALISGTGKRTATLLQILKDTGARIGEASHLRWTDVNMENSTIAINNPEKGSSSRTLKVSSKTIAMLNALPKKGPFIFNVKPRTLESTFDRQRNRLALKLQNPRLKQIHFHTFRHWNATMTYHKTRNILLVKYRLGHKRLENTEVYTHLVDFENDEYDSAAAQTKNEARQLIDTGFDYVTTTPDGFMLFRKRK